MDIKHTLDECTIEIYWAEPPGTELRSTFGPPSPTKAELRARERWGLSDLDVCWIKEHGEVDLAKLAEGNSGGQ